MSGFPEDLLHGAMADAAYDAAGVMPTADGWEDVRARARRRRSARRRAQLGALLVGSVALIGGLALLAAGGGRDSARIQVVDSTPPTTAAPDDEPIAADEIVAVSTEGHLVVLDAADGTENRVIALQVQAGEPGAGRTPETFGVVPYDVTIDLSEDRTVVFHDGVASPECPDALYAREVTSVPVIGYDPVVMGPDGATWPDEVPVAAGTQLASGRWPASSPDGKRLAYVRGVDPCDGPGELVVRDLATGAERVWSVPDFADGGPQGELVGPLGFYPDSHRLLVPINREPATEWWDVDTDAAPGAMQGERLPLVGEGGPYSLWVRSDGGLEGAFADGWVGSVSRDGTRSLGQACPGRVADCRVADVLSSPDGAGALLLVSGNGYHGLVDYWTGSEIADDVVAADW